MTSAMVPFSWRLGALLAALVVLAMAGTADAATPPATHIAQVRPGVSLSEAEALVRRSGGKVTGRVSVIHGLAVQLPAGAVAPLARAAELKALTPNGAAAPRSVRGLVDGDLETLGTDPDADLGPTAPTDLVEQVAPAPAPQDGLAALEAGAGAVAELALDIGLLATSYPASVRAPDAWLSATGRGVGVAVIDTGIDGALEDFRDANGGPRVVASVTTNPGATTARDTYGHGTHIAGIIAGHRRTGELAGRYTGIAPEASLISVKVDDDEGVATILDVIYGLQFVVDHREQYGIRVVNLSLESASPESYRTDPLDAAVEAAHFAGILVVAAAGNRGDAADAAHYAPGNDPFALTVGAVDDQGTDYRLDDAYTEWSSFGLTQDGYSKPDIAAPGAHIVSTLAEDSEFASLCPTCIIDGDYIRAGGTSMAAPVVAGVAALMFERHPSWTPDDVKRTLIQTARDVDGVIDEVNAARALEQDTPAPVSTGQIDRNELIDPVTGQIDYTRSHWSRSHWSAESGDDSAAGWTRSHWSCTCPTSMDAPEGEGEVDPTRSHWSRSHWSRSHWSTKWTY